MPKNQQLLVAIGGNQEFGGKSPISLIPEAISRLNDLGLGEMLVSHLYKSTAFPVGSGPDYVNAALRLTLRKNWAAAALLQQFHAIEAKFGRERARRWGPRTLDIDLLALDDSVLPDLETQAMWRDLSLEEQARRVPDQLILPHPRLQDRAFVLVPLCDVAPDWVHPALGLTVRQMRDRLGPGALGELTRL